MILRKAKVTERRKNREKVSVPIHYLEVIPEKELFEGCPSDLRDVEAWDMP